MYLAACVIAIVAAWALLALRVDPVPTWFYVFIWYPTLGVFDAVAARRAAERPILRRPRLVLSLLGWSVPIWLLFEAANFRLLNWYYVFLPDHPVERWAGIVISFATVVPAALLAERLLRTFAVGERWRTRGLRMTRARLAVVWILGVLTTVLALARPAEAFALIWACVWLLTDPLVYVRRPEWSLLGDLERGRPGRIGRLLVGGLFIGVLWEAYNGWARGKWIYTVPWLEELKWFEMPPLGFLGFPFLALEAWAVYQLLCSVGVAEPMEGDPVLRAEPGARGDAGAERGAALSPPRKMIAYVVAIAFSTLVLLGMERRTISSTTPRLRDLPSITIDELRALRVAGVSSPFALADSEPARLAETTRIPPERLDTLRDRARLATLRGIGAAHAHRLVDVGIASVCALARADPDALWNAMREEGQRRPTAAEVRVWVRAGARNCRLQIAD